MKQTLWVSGLVLAAMYCAAWAQEQPTTHAPDGNSWERIQSIDVPEVTSAPFTATVTTELTKVLADNSKQTNWNHRTIARDSSGRVFQERRFFAPNGDKVTTPLSELDYVDPNRHELYICKPMAKTCNLYPYNAPQKVALMPAGPLPNGRGTVERQALGQKTIDDIEVIGSREITTLNAGAVGNEKTEPIVKEFWYSPRLQINIITKRFDPRFGVQNFIVSNINQSEPNPKLFEPPDGYRVVKMSGQ
jgi:hypothetical protein